MLFFWFFILLSFGFWVFVGCVYADFHFIYAHPLTHRRRVRVRVCIFPAYTPPPLPAHPTGLVSLELVSHTHSILGIDISQGMVDYYNARFAGLGHPPEKVHALVAEFDPAHPETSVPQEMKGKEFDLVYVRTRGLFLFRGYVY